jgi:hypothetical protein
MFAWQIGLKIKATNLAAGHYWGLNKTSIKKEALAATLNLEN